MLVDDEADTVAVLEASFKKGGFAIHAYTNPQHSLEDFKPSFYDILILDIRMPIMDGFELYQRIRKVDPKVKVCFFTAFQTAQEIYELTVAGSDANVCFVKKPVTGGVLLKLINDMLLTPN